MRKGYGFEPNHNNIGGQLETKESNKNICAICLTLFQAILNWWHCPLDADESKVEMSRRGRPFKIARKFLTII